MVKYTGDLSYPRKMDDMSELHHHQLLRPKEEQFPKIERNGYYLQYFKHLIVYCYSFQTQFIILSQQLASFTTQSNNIRVPTNQGALSTRNRNQKLSKKLFNVKV